MHRFALALLILLTARSAAAWGCDGHRAIAILAERYAKPSAVAAAKALLAAHPIDSSLSRFCGPAADPIVEASTWPDDYRTVDPSTGPWHFIDFPLAVADAVAHFDKYCPSGQCVVAQIAEQYAIAKTSSSAAARARALRFLIHLIGDIHQPLHAIANGDRGGNCVPVTYFGQPPVDANGTANYSPNLHGVWDALIVSRLMQSVGAATPAALATSLDPHASPSAVQARTPTKARALAWASASYALAKSTSYGKLPTAVPIEPASQVMIASCGDNNHVAQRMLALNEVLEGPYDAAARPVVRAQMRAAAKRLAETLDALFSK